MATRCRQVPIRGRDAPRLRPGVRRQLLIAGLVGNLGPVYLSEHDDSTRYYLARNEANCHTLKPANGRDRRLRGVERRVGVQVERLRVDARLDSPISAFTPLFDMVIAL